MTPSAARQWPVLPHRKSLLYALGPHFPKYRTLSLHLLLKQHHRKFKRIPSKYSAKPQPHLCSMQLHLQSQRHQRATGFLHTRISGRNCLLRLDAARAHRSNRESRTRFHYLARRQCCLLTHCTRSERVAMPVAVPTPQRRNRLYLWPIARKCRKYPR